MATCANCSSDALYVYQISPKYGINYCQRHLPTFLSRGPQPNLFAAPQEPVIENTAKVKKTKAVAEPVEEPVVEETVESVPTSEVVDVVEEDASNS